MKIDVTPLVGARIEIPQMHRTIPQLCVTPLVGARIEMIVDMIVLVLDACHSPRGSAD